MIPVICIAGGQMEAPSFFTYPPVGKRFETSRAISAAPAAGRLEVRTGWRALRERRQQEAPRWLRTEKVTPGKMPHPG